MKVNQLRAGIWLSYLNLALGSLIPVFYTPIMLGILGQAEHGLYSLAQSVVGYLGLLSFGFGSTIIRYIAKYRADNNRRRIREIFGFFIILYAFLAFLVIISGIFLSNNVSLFLNQGLSEHEISSIQTLIILLTINTSVMFMDSVVSSVIIAYEKFIYKRTLDIISTVVSPFLNLSFLVFGMGAYGLVISGLAIQIFVFAFNCFYCLFKMGIIPSFVRIKREMVSEIICFSAFIFIGSIADTLFWATDKVIIGGMIGTAAVSIYQIGCTFNNIVVQMSTSVSGLLAPKVTGMVVREKATHELSDLFIKVGRLQFIITSLVISGFSIFGRSFIMLWAGKEYLMAYWVAILTLLPLSIPLIQNTGLSILVAQNRHKFRSIMYLIIAALNALSTYLIVPYSGIMGASLCTFFSYLLGQGLIMNLYYSKVIGIDIKRFWKSIMMMALPMLIVAVIGWLLFANRIDLTWAQLFVYALGYSIVYLIVTFFFSMNGYEKNIFIGPLKKIIKLSWRERRVYGNS